MSIMDEYDKEREAYRKHRAGYAALDYTGEPCNCCGRNRVMNCVNGKKVCDKCGWDNINKEFTDYLSL